MQVKYRVHTDMLNVAGRISNKSEPFSRKNQWLLFLWFNILSCNHLMQRTVLEMQTARLMEELFYQSRLIRRRELWPKITNWNRQITQCAILDSFTSSFQPAARGITIILCIFGRYFFQEKFSHIFHPISEILAFPFLYRWKSLTNPDLAICGFFLPKCFYFMRSIKRIQILVKHAFSSKFVINIDRSIPLKKEKVFS